MVSPYGRVGRVETPKLNFTDDDEKWLPRGEKMSPISPRSSHSHAVTTTYSVSTTTSIRSRADNLFVLAAHLITLVLRVSTRITRTTGITSRILRHRILRSTSRIIRYSLVAGTRPVSRSSSWNLRHTLGGCRCLRRSRRLGCSSGSAWSWGRCLNLRRSRRLLDRRHRDVPLWPT